MRLLLCVAAFALLLATCAAADKPAAKARVSLELVTEEGFPITGAQQWYQVFADLGVGGLRIRGATGAVEVEVKNRGSKDAPIYDVVGLIKANNTLYLPGGKFTVNDSARLKKWLADLADQGTEAVTQPRQAFGMTRSQLVEIDGEMKKPLLSATKDAPADKAVGQLAQGLQHKLQIDPAMLKSLAAVAVEEELQGVSCGTALAVILRPAGLAYAPSGRAAGRCNTGFSSRRPVARVGQLAGRPTSPTRKSRPTCTPNSSTSRSIRLPSPRRWPPCRSGSKCRCSGITTRLALHGIDPAKIEAKLPAKKLTYSLILQRVLSQAKLRKELRVDEAGKPFLWITTIKPS